MENKVVGVLGCGGAVGKPARDPEAAAEEAVNNAREVVTQW